MIAPASPTSFRNSMTVGRASEILQRLRKEEAKTPAGGNYPILHAQTFSSMRNSVSNTYGVSDEALKHAAYRAPMMRNDPCVMECLEARQRATALLKWHLETDDSKHPIHKALIDRMTKRIKQIPYYIKYRYSLCDAFWYGRSANAHKWGRKVLDGRINHVIEKWRPIHGDKLVFKYAVGHDDGWAEDQIGIRVSPLHVIERNGRKMFGNREVVPLGRTVYTDQGMAYFIDPSERATIAIHKHIVEDGPFEDVLSAGRIHGVGIRDRIYWTWYQKQEALATIMLLIERFGTGFTIVRFPANDVNAEKKVRQLVEEHRADNIILFPAQPGDPNYDAYSIERIEPTTAGIELVDGVVHRFFGHQIKRYIVGQTLTSEATGTGMNSNLADVQLGTFMQIVQFDAANLAETETNEVVRPLQIFNEPELSEIQVRMVIESHGDEAEKVINNYKTGWEMGAQIPEKAVQEVLNIPEAELGERILSKAAVTPMMPGIGGGSGSPLPGAPPALPQPPQPPITPQSGLPL